MGISIYLVLPYTQVNVKLNNLQRRRLRANFARKSLFLIVKISWNSIIQLHLVKLPKRPHSQAKDKIHSIWMTPTKEAVEAFDLFVATYQSKYPNTVRYLKKDAMCC